MLTVPIFLPLPLHLCPFYFLFVTDCLKWTPQSWQGPGCFSLIPIYAVSVFLTPFTYPYHALTQRTSYPLPPNNATQSILPRLLDQWRPPLQCLFFSDLFWLHMVWMSIFPSEKSIPWWQKFLWGFCCWWCCFVLFLNNVPRETNTLKFLSVYLKESFPPKRNSYVKTCQLFMNS